MEKGVSYEKAITEADREERKERRRAQGSYRLTDHGQKLPEGKDFIQSVEKT